MTTLGELASQLLGWLGEFIGWLISFIPRYQIIRCNELGVKYVGGSAPVELRPDQTGTAFRWWWWFCGPIRWLPNWHLPWIYRTIIRPIGESRGFHWYWPVTTDISTHHTNLQTLPIDSVSLETKDGIKAQFGMVVSYRIVDAIQFEVENYDADQSMDDVAKAGLRNIVVEHDWADLTAKASEGSRFEKKLMNRMQISLGRFGVEVESARPNDQIRLDWAGRAFGLSQDITVGKSSDD